ncbi:hypothetical protein AK88_04561 [Plasmodium fragile]|uniref:Uncharacterized protein n=1 Tax=Plasmodium fragile TaxID=5857 RepID=A0A0D9QG70_PLAFR|nr:uncharacterized protein AK88_04561 [Plasmodium fragile]KJP85802.1 hypothetical protein AK88_04561 [Plasmodium fragile]
MVRTNSSHMSYMAKNEGRNNEKNVLEDKNSDSSGKDTLQGHKTAHGNNKFPFYLKLSMLGILVLVLQCFNEIIRKNVNVL